MSRIHLNIDRLVLNGFQPLEAKALSEALQSQLFRLLSNPVMRAEWAFSHRTPVLRLGRMSWEQGPSGSRKLGASVARAIGRRLKP